MKPHLLALATSLLLAAQPPPPVDGPSPFAVEPKARAFTVETMAVAGGAVLHAKDHVDLVAVLQDDKRPVAVTLLQNVIVLANASPSAGEPRQLSLLVLPEEAQLLALAKSAGQLTATLRNPSDLDVLEERATATVASAVSGQLTPVPKGAKK